MIHQRVYIDIWQRDRERRSLSSRSLLLHRDGEGGRGVGDREASGGLHRPRHRPHVAARRLPRFRRLRRLPFRRRFRPRLGPVPPRRHPLHPLARPPSLRLLLQARSLLPTLRLDPHRRRQDGNNSIISLSPFPLFLSFSSSDRFDSSLISNPLPLHPRSLNLDGSVPQSNLDKV